MINLGISVLIKETWNWLCFGRRDPQPSWEPSPWPTVDPYHTTIMQVLADITDNAGMEAKAKSKAVMLDSASLEAHEKQTNFPTAYFLWYFPTLCTLPPSKRKTLPRNRSESQQSCSICPFLGKCINRNKKIAIKGKGKSLKIVI